ncbi:MAG: YdiU family protein, partial [Paracoccaceae bacterium]|nr:YdiU family protein [Paracoccaceae bacterium]
NAQFPFDNTYSTLPRQFFHKQKPAAVSKAELIACNFQLAKNLEIKLPNSELELIFSGQLIPEGADPLAQVYAGHQFGYYNPQLGDGRALLLGELNTKLGRYDIQLKGSGTTPYSRSGDGLSWLGPVLREYIVSEAMHHLGISTTRSLAAVATGDKVLRETVLPGAILTRIAKSHIRVGTFQYFASNKDLEALKTLYNYTRERHYNEANSISEFFRCVINAQSNLVTDWLSVGFIHGVMNTDNCSISGETIDYGPCAFLDKYSPSKVFSSIDSHGRYAYSAQADVIVWNMAQLANALLPIVQNDEEILNEFKRLIHEMPNQIRSLWLKKFGKKIGIAKTKPDDYKLISNFLNGMASRNEDFTISFRRLTEEPEYFKSVDPDWFETWKTRTTGGPDPISIMAKANPNLIPRNHHIELAIKEALNADFTLFYRLNEALKSPYEKTLEYADLETTPTEEEEVIKTFCGT